MPSLPSRAEIEAIAPSIDAIAPRTPHFRWPLLDARAGCELWVKHENHTVIGSFKLRGALAYVARLREREPATRGVIAATRGNFGQAVAFAAARHQLAATIVVPHGNNPEKNRAMRALGAELVEHGADFQAALEHAVVLARERGLHAIPSFHPDLVLGNAVSALDFLAHTPPLDAVYVPIGLGSGICALAAARAALGLTARTQLIGVASDAAPGIALSFAARHLVSAPATTRIADGMACSTPDPDALTLILGHVTRIVRVTDEEVEAAIGAYFSDTHNVAEGAAAAALAAVLREREAHAGRRLGVVLTGGNIDAPTFARVLARPSHRNGPDAPPRR
jgi:threonine dehydratase